MHIKSVAVRALLVPVCWVAMSVPSLARPVCWIDHVVKANGGIEVYFIQKAILRIDVNENSGGTSIRYVVSSGVVQDEGAQVQDHLFVKDGVELYASQMAHDSCSYKVKCKRGSRQSDREVSNAFARAPAHFHYAGHWDGWHCLSNRGVITTMNHRA